MARWYPPPPRGSKGVSIDWELIVILADETIQATRPTQEEHERPEFTKDWA